MPDGDAFITAMDNLGRLPDQVDPAQEEFNAFMAERRQIIDQLFATRDQPKPVQPYPDPVRPLLVGAVEGVSSAVGGTIAGTGTVFRWLDSATNGQAEGWLSDLASIVEKGGSWIQEHPLLPKDSLAKLQATVAFPILSDDGQPIWDARSWATDAQGQFDMHRRLWEATRSMAGQIGEGTGLMVTLLGPGKVLKLSQAANVALGVSAMSSINASSDYKKLVQSGVDPDIAARHAALYGAVTGPIGYAEAVLGSRVFKDAVGAVGEAAGKGKAFQWATERILGHETGTIPTIPSMAVMGLQNDVMGWAQNPVQQSAFDAMKARKPDWQPTGPENWYTLEQAYSDFALGAGMVGFLRGAGRIFHSKASSVQTAKLEDAGHDTSQDALRPDQKSTIDAPASTGNAWRNKSEVQAQLTDLFKSYQEGRSEEIKDIANEDLIRAAMLYAEDPKAGLKYYSDRMNVAILDDTKGLPSNEDRTIAVEQRKVDIAKDDSRALRFLNDNSATDRPIPPDPLWVPDKKQGMLLSRSIDKAKVADDTALETALGLPLRTDKARLPSEQQAIDALRSGLDDIWTTVPNAKVKHLVSPLVAIDPAEARKMGLDATTMPRDQAGRALYRVGPSVAFVDGVATIQLPRDFTLKDLRQAHTQLLGTENLKGKGPDVVTWNENVAHINRQVAEWWTRVEPEVKKTAAFDPTLNLSSVPEDQRLGVVSQKLSQLLGQAQSEGKVSHAAALTRLQQMLTTPDLTNKTLDSAVKTLDRIAKGFPATAEIAKSRQLLEIIGDGKPGQLMKGVAHLMARPEAMPESARMTREESGMLDATMRQQNPKFPLKADNILDSNGRKMTVEETVVRTQQEEQARIEQAEADEKADIAKTTEELMKGETTGEVPELNAKLEKGFTNRAVEYGRSHTDPESQADLQRRLDEGTKVLDEELAKDNPDMDKLTNMSSTLQWYREALEASRGGMKGVDTAVEIKRSVSDEDIQASELPEFPDYATFRKKFEAERDAKINETEDEYLMRKYCQ